MASFLLKTEAAIEDSNNHLIESNALNTQIANYLAQYISIIFCAEMEQAIKSIFNTSLENKIADLPDNELQEFIKNQLKRLKSNSIKKSDIADYVKNFSDHAKVRFNEQLKDNDAEITQYSNVLAARHSIAHTATPSQITFIELEHAVTAANTILKAMQIAMQNIED
jgi:hypothetical protein